jgi:hypothetical protein
MDIIAYLKQVPPTAWAAAFGSTAGALLALPGLVLSLRHARKLQANQLAHDSMERTLERQMAWRRQVYLEAAESTSRLSNLLGRLADLSISDADLSRGYIEDFAKISRIEVIANVKTISAIHEYLTAFGSAYARLGTERGVLVSKQNQIQSYEKQIQIHTEGQRGCEVLLLQYGEKLNAKVSSEIALRMEVHRRQSEHCSNERLRLMDELPRGQLALWKACIDAGFEATPFLTKALLAAREELALPMGAGYSEFAARSTTVLRGSVNAAVHTVEGVVAAEDARQTDPGK